MAAGSSTRTLRINWRVLSALIVAGCLMLFAAANAHLVYVALNSQPECVPHIKTLGEDGMFRAARSSC